MTMHCVGNYVTAITAYESLPTKLPNRMKEDTYHKNRANKRESTSTAGVNPNESLTKNQTAGADDEARKRKNMFDKTQELNLDDVQRLYESERIDFLYQPISSVVSGAMKNDTPVLHFLIWTNQYYILRSVLQKECVVDWRTVDKRGRTVFHLLCDYMIERDDAVRFLRMFVDRIERHPRDTVDWSLRDVDGRDFISLAAEHQRLSLFWAVVQGVPYYDDADIVRIDGCGWEWDWEELPREEQERFVVESSSMVVGSKATGALIEWYARVPYQMDAALRDYLKQCISGSGGDVADIMIATPDRRRLLLFDILLREDWRSFVMVMDEYPNGIDFTVKSMSGANHTLLDMMCMFTLATPLEADEQAARREWEQRVGDGWVATEPETRVLLVWGALLKRLAAKKKDVVDFAETNGFCRNVFSTAAFYGVLHVVFAQCMTLYPSFLCDFSRSEGGAACETGVPRELVRITYPVEGRDLAALKRMHYDHHFDFVLGYAE